MSSFFLLDSPPPQKEPSMCPECGREECLFVRWRSIDIVSAVNEIHTSLVVVATLQQLALFFVFYFVYYSLFWFLHAKPKLLASSTAK